MRFEIYENEKLIGVDYQMDNGDWMHKWVDWRTGKLERGSWRLRCQGDNMSKWEYREVAE